MGIRYETILPFYRFLWKFWREERYRRFKVLMAPKKIDRLLDVGGSAGDWLGRGDVVAEVDSLNLTESKSVDGGAGSPIIRCICGDGRALKFDNSSYDVVYSNSVIEHVGDVEDQAAFAQEIRRVGKKLWVQTPAFGCPVEPHFLGVGVHWVPIRWRWPLVRWFSVIGITGAAGDAGLRAIMETTRLLKKREFAALFPDCEIHTERFLWIFPKSYIAIRR